MEEIRGNDYYAEKEFEIIIIPEKNGKVTFPEIKLPYFDTKKRRFSYLKIKSFDIEIKGSKTSFSGSNLSNTIIKVTKSIKTQNENDVFIFKIKKTKLKTITFFIIFGLLMLSILTIVLLQILKFRKKAVLKRLFGKIKDDSNSTEVYDILSKMIEFRYNISLKTMSIEEFNKQFGDKELIEKMSKLLDFLNKKGFGDLEITINIKDEMKGILDYMLVKKKDK